MTVTYLKDGRIEVKDPHDALLLSLAGIPLVNENKLEQWQFNGTRWGVLNKFYDGTEYFNDAWMDKNTTLYVPADVARGLVLVLCQILGDLVTWGGEDITMATPSEYLKNPTWDNIYVRRHNDRWNLLPEIEMEMEK